MTDSVLDYLFNHLFLPTRVPQADDHGNGSGDRAFAEHIAKSAALFRDANNTQYYQQWSILCRALQSFATLHRHNNSLSKESLKVALRGVTDGDILILHVAVQNSALLLRKNAEIYIIESFEASPPAAEVLSAHRALQWDFPSRAVAVPSSTFENESFQTSLADFLERASIEPVKQFAATTLKAGSFAYESRNTTTPAIVGQLLMSLLEANGHNHKPMLTRKRVRDEVCWSDGAENPWRRSATWLVLRTCVQRCLCFLLGGSLGTLHYKFFTCFIVSSLCKKLCAADSYPADRLAFARTKLARRAAKLEQQKAVATPQLAKAIDSLFQKYRKEFTSVIQTINARLDQTWNLVRARTTRPVELLPRRADQNSTVLSLLHSRDILWRILDEALYGRPRVQLHLEQRLRNVRQYSVKTESRDARSVSDYLDLADVESELQLFNVGYGEIELPKHPDHTCIELKTKLQQYQNAALSAYKSNPEQLSLMLLTIMELWQALDTLALRLYPLLREYNPGFPRNLLYPLQAASLRDLRRLQRIEDYIDTRCGMADPTTPSIFGDISSNSYAVRYFDRCPEMQELLGEIKLADQSARARKEEELRTKSTEYENLLKDAAQTACLFMEDEIDPSKRQHDDRHCRKHFLERKAARMRILVHEAVLPTEIAIAKAIIFELIVPEGFAGWRDTTWQILQLARPSTLQDRTPQVLLREYTGLSAYKQPMEANITLASRTKSFQTTHYAQVPFPANTDQICLPHGLKYGLYDQERSLWTSRHTDTLSFANLCSPSMPPKSVYASLRKFLHPTFEGTPVSANEVVASQTRCPNTLTMAEFTTFQDLRLGSGVQWLRLLRELASPNLNFGSVEVGTLVSELAFMSGPPLGRSPRRANHWVFRHAKFCEALAAQIRKRLDGIAANWREGQTVDCMIVLLQSMWSLAHSPHSVKEAESLLLYVRKMTHGWARLLRNEICNATDIETAQKRSKDALLAAILSRKTFMIEAAEPDKVLQPDALACFLECGFTIKDNLPKNEPGYITKMSASFRRLFIADLKLVQGLEDQLRMSVHAFPKAVDQAVNNFWAETGGSPSRRFTPWMFLSTSYRGWLKAQSVSQDGLLEQEVHIDLFEGTLLIDGQQLGRLPEEYTKQEFFQQLFGTRVFLTYPSSLPGMSYMLASLFQGNEIHFGFRAGIAFIRARSRGRIRELIPPTVFISKTGGEAPDLPLPLINDSVHWLDLNTQSLEIRPFGTMWQVKQSNWTINLRTNQAWRRTSLLVDPRSPIFHRVASLIEPFEHRSRMTVFQPERGDLSLHLPGLELSFRVNREGLLESQQLRAVVDSNQDAGTLYGLKSSLVLRDCVVPEDRSIIVAIGPAEIVQNPNGNHVGVQINHTGFYARFFINRELGRLECAAEPRLIYFKAYCHAVTAFILPDPLTGRTGTDEAIHCLQAGNAQPWAPVDGESYRILVSIAELTPRRVYYPENLKALQRVIWKEELMPILQHDAFRPIIKDILHQCRLLHRFHLSGNEPPPLDQPSDEHLLARASARNQSFRAFQHQTTTGSTAPDPIYVARDSITTISSKNTYEAAILLKKSSRRIAVNHDLARRMQEWPAIQGFDHDFELYLFADLINIDLSSCWGSIFKLCQQPRDALDKYRVMFLFATISFDAHIDMTLIRSLIAVNIMEDFKTLELPRSSVFTNFRGNQVPTIDFLAQFMRPYRVAYPEDERALLTVAIHPKQRRKLETAQFRHEQQSEDSCKLFARHLLLQWPCREPSIDGLVEMPLLDLQEAFLAIKPEWERLFNNHQLSEHLTVVQGLLNRCEDAEALVLPSTNEEEQAFFPFPTTSRVQPTIWDLVCKPIDYGGVTERRPLSDLINVVKTTSDMVPGPKVPQASGTEVRTLLRNTARPPSHMNPQPQGSVLVSELQTIVSAFANSDNAVRQTYGKDLQSSISALQKLQVSEQLVQATQQSDPTNLSSTSLSLRSEIQNNLTSVRETLVHGDGWLHSGGLLPDVTPVTLLEALPTLAAAQNPSSTFHAIIKYAQSIAELQHLLRIQSAHQRQDAIQLANETRHESQTKWQAKDYIDWLLLQIDFNLLIRRDQYEVAQAMITPLSGNNFVLQMNMGQGKSSVIIPMIVAQLANGKALVRVVVPRPLLLQTAQLLQSRLGGLIGRTLKHVPFSRKSSTEISNLKAYHNIHLDILHTRGVILTLPEHMLSFQLSGLQELSNGHVQQAASMLKIQDWFARKCKNILDECDHMLAVKTQLIYPSGSQSMVDGHPSRWVVVQDLLKLVKIHLGNLRRRFPRSIEVIERGPGMFPTIYLLNQDVKEALIGCLTDSVINGEEGVLSVDGCSQDDLESMGKFLRDATFPKTSAMKVGGILKGNTDARHRLLLLRGLLVHRILLMGLGKRWNVQYGVDPRRDPIAVPFRSKGIPSDQAEFGHPDVSIILTCLSFYYSGLTLPQFKQTLNQLLKSDEPAQEFESWMHDVRSFPDSLRSWNSINIEDDSQCNQLWVLLCQQIRVINFFLNRFVFPRHARTFERKLVSSGWDIATGRTAPDGGALPPSNENWNVGATVDRPLPPGSRSLTVGFSGTNDNKTLLPLNVLQNDLRGLSHTNAEVLTYLLQPRNKQYFPATDVGGKRLTERDFLQKLHVLGIRMLLDAGAQIIELDNLSLAKAWLVIDFEAEAAVYFGEDGRARVVYRDGRGQPLASSPFWNNLGSCVVYLDEAHTRGVDLKMPANAIAALTLGIMQTKDHTVQGMIQGHNPLKLLLLCFTDGMNSC